MPILIIKLKSKRKLRKNINAGLNRDLCNINMANTICDIHCIYIQYNLETNN